MELPNLGQHCSKPHCNKLDFLPIKCDMCFELFCNEHFSYLNHDCKNAYRKDNQVPVCPLCNKPVPVPAGSLADQIVGAHIDTDCQLEPTKKVFTNKCSVKSCKGKEIIPVVCVDCQQNFCLRHRHPQDHQCEGKKAARKKAVSAALARLNSNQRSSSQVEEDEDLARAMALSIQDSRNSKPHLSQEEQDLALARQLQAEEYQANSSQNSNQRNTRERCAVV